MAEPGPSRSAGSPRFEVEIVGRAELWDRVAVGEPALARAAQAAFMAAPPTGQGCYAATLVLVDDQEMQTLNRTWRGKDAATNVLSFPAGEAVGQVDEDFSEPRPLGDVVLAGETILREAAAQNIAVTDHAAHLVVHGVLHLLGYDHMRDDEAEAMEALETNVLLTLGIADPYAETAPVASVDVAP
jgi:probable rRNA maturation factor